MKRILLLVCIVTNTAHADFSSVLPATAVVTKKLHKLAPITMPEQPVDILLRIVWCDGCDSISVAPTTLLKDLNETLQDIAKPSAKEKLVVAVTEKGKDIMAPLVSKKKNATVADLNVASGSTLYIKKIAS